MDTVDPRILGDLLRGASKRPPPVGAEAQGELALEAQGEPGGPGRLRCLHCGQYADVGHVARSCGPVVREGLWADARSRYEAALAAPRTRERKRGEGMTAEEFAEIVGIGKEAEPCGGRSD